MPSINVTNEEFLNTVFGEDWKWTHVTDFTDDPDSIPDGKHLHCWKGDFHSRYKFSTSPSNQYFTVSQFFADDQQVARRRKILFRHTNCIVLDDVREKLNIEEVNKLPTPAWILETSKGSEQWGYILDAPCTERPMVENLLDGLVANGLAPNGKDPGMKGVTRYVRLPGGYNTKAKRFIDGLPFKCEMLLWQPFNRVKIEELAAPFQVNLYANRRESRIDGAAAVMDHPLLELTDMIHIKEVRSDGRYDITCPWVDEHTGAVDNGSAIFTNGDGTIGFKCHHGNCDNRTGRDVLNIIQETYPKFGEELKMWQSRKAFAEVMNNDDIALPPIPAPPTPAPNMPQEVESSTYQSFFNALRSTNPDSDMGRKLAGELLKQVDSEPPMDRLRHHKELCDLMRWNKNEFKIILEDLRSSWYTASSGDVSFFNDVIYVGEQNRFFDASKRIFYTAEAYQNSYAHLDAEVRKTALTGGMVTKVDKIDYAPDKPAVFVERGIKYGNAWNDLNLRKGTQGDVSRWLDHFDVIGWGEHKQHILQFFAYTLLNPGKKINHMIIMGGPEGSGKDYLLEPLIKALGDHSATISGEELLGDFSDYGFCIKHLHINEAELGDRREAKAVSSKLKPLAAAPPDKIRINPKGVTPLSIRNIFSCTMTTNSYIPVTLDNGPSRRILALWSNLTPRDENDNLTPEWDDYWTDRWEWMKDKGGIDACIYYLRNCVSLEGFKPQSAPPVTQFLRDISDASKSPLQQTLESFIRIKKGAFERDIVTADDMLSTLKAGMLIAPDSMYVDVKHLTPHKINAVMRKMSKITEGQMSVSKYESGSTRTVWIIRHKVRYEILNKDQMKEEYDNQLLNIRKTTTLTAVPNN